MSVIKGDSSPPGAAAQKGEAGSFCSMPPHGETCGPVLLVTIGGRGMGEFQGRHFRGKIALRTVCWYCRYSVSYRDLEAMTTERGVAVDHSTIYR